MFSQNKKVVYRKLFCWLTISNFLYIIVLLILAGFTILTLTGENGIHNKGNTAKEETNEKVATEIMNLKITNAQIKSYSETEQMPDLQYLANLLCEDNDMEYVELLSQNKNIANTNETFLPLITVPENGSIFTKLKEYPYEFEIDGHLRLASIDGIQVAEKDNSITITEEELAAKIDAKVNEKVNEIIDTKVNEKVNAIVDSKVEEALSSSTKTRSDEYENVPFKSGSKYTAPCDGYYCFSGSNSNQTGGWCCYVIHYSTDNQVISYSSGPSYNYGHCGCEIYLKKGEYITFYNQNTRIDSSKFFYAEGSKP